MLRITNLTGSSTILQLLINASDKNKDDGSENDGNKTRILSISFMSNKKSTELGYLTFSIKKAFNLLRHVFT